MWGLVAFIFPISPARAGRTGEVFFRQVDYVPAREILTAAPEKEPDRGSGFEPDAFITQTMIDLHMPGVAAAVIKNGRLFWTGSYGYANIEENTATADTTSFMLASISKTVTGTALMQVWENGRFDLDDDINDYLPFTVANPHYPTAVITFRHLLTHTSSLRDNWAVMYSVYSDGDCPIPLGEYVQNYFSPGGQYYDSNDNFYSWAPGTAWSYCNEAFALAGYLVEVITGIPFDQYCRDSIFTPLGLPHTSWFLAGLDTANVAMPYTYAGGSFTPIGHYGYADYPAGQLRSSACDLARHLMVYLNGGQVDGVRILEPATVDTILTVQFPDIKSGMGLFWFGHSVMNRPAWQHGGGDAGVSTLASFCPETDVGVVVLTNASSGGGTSAILNMLYDFAKQDFILSASRFSDNLGGDGDGLPEPGETVELVCSFVNFCGDSATDVTAVLTLDDAAVNVTDGTVYLGDVAAFDTVSTADDPFELVIPPEYIPRLDSLYLAFSWNDGRESETLVVAKAIGGISILLVDDDFNHSIEGYYTEIVAHARIPSAVRPSPPFPTALELSAYDVVIWITGNYRDDPLDSEEIAAMKGYLDAGGNLLLTGQGVAAQLENFDHDFLTSYLKSDYLSTSLIPVLAADQGGQVFDPRDTVCIQGSGGASNQTAPDHITAVNGGTAELWYLGTTDPGVVVYKGTCASLFAAFGLEAVVTGNSRWMGRDAMLARILDFFEYRWPAVPIAVQVSSGDPMHLTDHLPSISWDSGGFVGGQQMYQVQVGNDNDWTTAEMWDTGPVTGAATAVTYGGGDLIDSHNYYIRVRVSDGSAWSYWYYCQVRMNSRPSVPTDLTPDHMQQVEITPPSLSHANAMDNEGDVLSYSYEVYDDSLMSTLVSHASGLPEGSGGTSSWQIPSALPDGTVFFWRVRAGDGYEYGDWSGLASFCVPHAYVCGDANADAQVDVGDAVFVINYVFTHGPAPEPMAAGDAGCDGRINIGDAVYLINYVYRSGEPPCCR